MPPKKILISGNKLLTTAFAGAGKTKQVMLNFRGQIFTIQHAIIILCNFQLKAMW